MPISPIPRPDDVSRVKEIYPQAYPKWNRRFKRWDIVDKHVDGFEIILLAVRNDDGSYRPIDNRTFSQLRFMRWFNNKPHRMKCMLLDTVMKGHDKEAQKMDKNYDEICDISKEIAPLLRQMARDSGYSAYSKPVPFSTGFGPGQHALCDEHGRKAIKTI